VRFTSREREPDRQTAAVNHYMYLAGETSSRPAHGLSFVAGDASGVLMNAHNGGVDYLDFSIVSSG
jgi:hypothetical protein